MTTEVQRIVSKICGTGGDVPEWVLLFPEGWNELDDGQKFYVDRTGFDTMMASIEKRGIDIVWDYEHQTLTGKKAPASGWGKIFRYDDGVGVMNKVDWTKIAKGHLEEKEYRYFSPVFDVRKSDRRVVGLHSVALTNSPKTNNQRPLVAKHEAGTAEGESNMKRIAAKLGLPETSTEDEIMAKLDETGQKPQTTFVISKSIMDALDLTENDDESTVVASIHALKQTGKNSVSKAEFDALKKTMLDRDVTEIVAKAMTEGKITPDQKDWAKDYATQDFKGFEMFIAKAPVVIPVKKIGDHTKREGDDFDETTVTIAASMGLNAEDLKKHA